MMEGHEPSLPITKTPNLEEEIPQTDAFLDTGILKELSLEVDDDVSKIRSLGRHLLNVSSTEDVLRQNAGDPELAVYKMLKRWKAQHRKTDDKTLTRQLLRSLRESGMVRQAAMLQERYKDHVTSDEGTKLLAIFDEIKSCPAVLINWKLVAKNLGLDDKEVRAIQMDRPELRRRCSSMLKKAFEKYRSQEIYYRGILLRYIQALELSGCPRIAASIERRHLHKFYLKSD